MNIAYVTWIENLKSNILKGQVIEILKQIKKKSSKDCIYLFAFLPLFHILRHYGELHNIKNELRSSGIHLIIIPCLIWQRYINWFYAKWYILPFVFITSFPQLLVLVYYKNINILHCRSYPIMLAAIITKLIKKSIKIIFDPRSPFPEESITKGRWTEGSLSYKAWKSLEAIFLKRSDVTIAIANTYVEHFSKMCPNVRCIVIPNNVDVKKIKPNPKLRINIRSKLELDDDEILFVYIGCMGNLWNNPNIYAKFIIKLRKLYIKHHFLFITPNIEIVKQIFDKYNIKREEYHVVCVEFDAVAEYLCAGDLGINLMAEKDIRLSIKTSEYLAMGFPIIINSNVLGAKEIIEKNKIGLIIEDVVNVNMNKIVALINERENISVKCRELAVKKYSNDKISKQYLNLYKALYRKES